MCWPKRAVKSNRRVREFINDMAKALIGTSGWTYRSWAGSFYPETLRPSDLLPYYSHRFPTVEVNTTFYRFPSTALVKGWERKSPPGFVFSVKAPRYFTHLKKLNVNDDDFRSRFSDFLERLTPLEKKLGPILFQLPPNLSNDLERLKNFLAFLPSVFSYAVEFRHASFFEERVYELLRKRGVAITIVSAPGIPYVPMTTAGFAYFRLHGASSWYNYHYSYDELKDVAAKMIEIGPAVKKIYVYFDNDAEGFAVENARSLSEIYETLSAAPRQKEEVL